MTDQERRTQAVLLIAEDDLRRRIIEFSPQISADVQVMAQIIRELVALEREKRGLDNPKGTLTLYPNKEKASPAEPELIGKGYVAGRFYRAMAWTKPDKLKVSLLPEKPK